jgi:hypothetical protein
MYEKEEDEEIGFERGCCTLPMKGENVCALRGKKNGEDERTRP